MGFDVDWIKKPTGFLKLIALVLLLVCFCLLFVRAYAFHVVFVVSGFFILLFWIFGYIFDGNKPGRRAISELIFLIGYAIYGIIEGIIMLVMAFDSDTQWKYSRGEVDGVIVASGILAIIVSVVFAIDAFFTFKKFGSGSGGGDFDLGS